MITGNHASAAFLLVPPQIFRAYSAQIDPITLHKTYFRGRRSSQLVVARYHNILEVTERPFVAEGHYTLL